jgi:PAS domain S-box-containing protein
MTAAHSERAPGDEGADAAADPQAAAALVQGFFHFPIPMTIEREGGRIAQANQAFLDLILQEGHEVIGQRLMDLGLRDLKPQAKGRAATRSTRLLMADGRVLKCDSRRIEPEGLDMFVSTYCLEGAKEAEPLAKGPDMAEYISEGLVFIDEEGRLEDANGAAEQLLQFETEECRGHKLSGIFSAMAIPEAAELVDTVMVRGRSEQREYYYDNDGEDRWISVEVHPRAGGAVMVIADRSKLRIDETVIRQGEQQYKRLVELSSDGIWSVDEEFVTTFVSPRMAGIMGCEKSDLNGIGFYEMMSEETAERVSQELSVLHSGLTAQVEAVMGMGDREVEVRIRASPILNEDLEFCGALMMITDLSELQSALADLRMKGAENEALRTVGPHGTIDLDGACRITAICQRIEEMSGLANASVSGKDILGLFIAEDRERLRHAWEFSLRIGAPMCEDVRLQGLKGQCWVQVSGKRRSDGGAIWSVYHLQKMKDLEVELRRTEALYNTVISNLPNGAIIFFDRDLRYQFAGGPLLKEIGLSSEDIAGLHISEAMEPGAVALMAPYYRATLEGREATVKTDGEGGRLIMTHFLPVHIEGEGIVGGMVVGIDITEYEQDLAGLRQAQVRLEEMFSRASEGMAITDRRGIVLKWNESMRGLTGLKADEAIGRPIWDIEFGLLLPSQKTQAGYRQLLEHHRSLLTRGRSAVSRREMTISGEGETQRCIEKDEFPLHGKDAEGLGIICRDITDRKFAELMLGMPGRTSHKVPGRQS